MPPLKDYKYYRVSVVKYQPKPNKPVPASRTKQETGVHHKRCFNQPEAQGNYGVDDQIELVKCMNESPCRPWLLIKIKYILLIKVSKSRSCRFNIVLIDSVVIPIYNMSVVNHGPKRTIAKYCPCCEIPVKSKRTSHKVYIAPNDKPNAKSSSSS